MARSRRTLLVLWALALVVALVLLWRARPSDAPAAMPTDGHAAATSRDEHPSAPDASTTDRSVVETGATPSAPAPVERDAEGQRCVAEVVDTDGHAIAGATVAIVDEGPLGEHTTGPDGRCALPVHVGPGHVVLSVTADGFIPLRIRYDRAPVQPIKLHQALTIRGRVLAVADHTPIAGASVRVSWRAPVEPALATNTDARGAFEFAGVPRAQEVLWRASADGYATKELAVQSLDEQAELELTLARGLPLVFEVVDALDGAPIAGAKLVSGPEDDTSDERGRVSTSSLCAVGGAEVRFEVSAPEHCTLFARVDPATAVPGETVRLPLLPGARLVGRVLGSDGAPVPDAMIALTGVENSRRTAADAGVAFAAALPAGWKWVSRAPGVRRSVDADGSFAFTGLFATGRTFCLSAQAPQRDPVERRDIELGAPGSTTEIDIVLPERGPVGVLAGTMSLDGVPCAGRIAWQGPTRKGTVQVDASGRFRAEDVECGTVVLTPMPFDLWSSPECSRLFAGHWSSEVRPDGAAQIDLALVANVAVISGRVVDSLGVPAAGVIVRADADRACFQGLVQTGVDGTFALRADSGVAAYRVVAKLGGRYAIRQGVAPGASGLELVLPDLARVRVRVVDARTREPLRSFRLRFESAGSATREFDTSLGSQITPDPLGWCQVELEAGTYDLTAGTSMRGGAVHFPATLHALRLAPGADNPPLEIAREPALSLDVRLAPGLAAWPANEFIVVLVESANWDGVRQDSSGWQVQSALGLRDFMISRLVSFDAQGRATLRELSPGSYRFKVFPPTMHVEPEEVVVTGSERESLTLRWARD